MARLIREDADNYYVREYLHNNNDEHDSFELDERDGRVKNPIFSEAWHYHLYEVQFDMVVSKRNGTYKIVGIRDGEDVLGELFDA